MRKNTNTTVSQPARFFLLCFVLFVCSLSADAIRYRVVDNFPLPICKSPGSNYIGQLHEGDEIDAIGTSSEGMYVRFMFKGEPAYVILSRLEEIEVAYDSNGNPIPPQIKGSTELEKKEANIPLLLLSLVATVVLIIPFGILYVGVYANLFFFVFNYRKLRKFYNKRAGVDFMPPKRWSRLLASGLIPIGVFMLGFGAWIAICKYADTPNLSADLGGGIGTVTMLLYLVFFHYPRLKSKVGKKQARWQTIYPVITLGTLIPVAIWLVNIAIVAAGVLLLSGIIFTYVIPSGGGIASGAMIQPNGTERDYRCQSCRYYNDAGLYCMLHNEATSPTSSCSNYN